MKSIKKLSKCDKQFIWQNVLILVLLLCFIGLLIYVIVTQVTEYYQQTDPVLLKIREHLRPLHPKVDGLKFYEGTKSYTINKKKVYLCLKDENKNYYNFNMLIYVAIHELAHVLCDEIGHTPKFHIIFKQLLEKAEALGIYDSSIPIIKNYCGHT